MSTPTPVIFTEGYDLERKIEDFVAQRSSAVAAQSRAAQSAMQVDFIGLDVDDRRVTVIRDSAAQLGLRLRFG